LPLLDQIEVARDGHGRARQRPDRVVAARACSHPSTRSALHRRGIGFSSFEWRDQIAQRQAQCSREGGSGRVTQKVYARRNVVERSFNRLKQFRGLAIRYAERAAYYRAEVVIASFVLWLRRDPQDGPPR